MRPSIENNGWALMSATARNDEFPDSFRLPSSVQRESLGRGEAAQLLFDIETREDGKVIDRGVDRMWVIVIEVLPYGYRGILDSEPGTAENLNLRSGDSIDFEAEHICKIDQPPEEYLKRKYSEHFR